MLNNNQRNSATVIVEALTASIESFPQPYKVESYATVVLADWICPSNPEIVVEATA